MHRYISLLILFFAHLVKAQDYNDHQIALKKTNDSVCLKECFQKAEWEIHSRSFFMSTINEGMLKDDYALASGAGIGVLTRPLYGFQAGISGFFVYNILSSNIHEPDSLTGLPNRYESGLFDIQDQHNKNDLDRLEELYLRYNLKKNSITIGKINLKTPFFNPQDGRMRPTLEEGVWVSVRESKRVGFSGGWIWDVSPRSTVRWFSLANSIGIYNSGVAPSGEKSSYSGNIEGNSGVALANIYIQPVEKLRIDLWESFIENVMNTALVEINTEQRKEGCKIYESVMFVHQDAVNNGGNSDPSKAYMEKGSSSNVISGRAGIKNKKFNISLNYTHITGDGRYLMPREWGREPFYTYLPRERNEGAGNVHAVVGKVALANLFYNTGASLAYGYYQLPDVMNFRLNKYGLPSYHQLNAEFNYSFRKVLKGLEVRALATAKLNQGKTYNNLKYIYNKVNMVNLNLIFDFKV